MKFYQEIIVLPNHEVGANFILSRLFNQIHLALVSIKEIDQDGAEKSPIGISFPEYQMGAKFGIIGSKLRLFAQNESELARLDAHKWLSRFADYIHISTIREVPQKIEAYAIYARYQPKTNKERIIRRHQKRESEWQKIVNDSKSSAAEVARAQENLQKRLARPNLYDKESLVKEPFIRLKSQSSDREFCLWIKKIVASQPNYQKFSTYGLSSASTLPEF